MNFRIVFGVACLVAEDRSSIKRLDSQTCEMSLSYTNYLAASVLTEEKIVWLRSHNVE